MANRQLSTEQVDHQRQRQAERTWHSGLEWLGFIFIELERELVEGHLTLAIPNDEGELGDPQHLLAGDFALQGQCRLDPLLDQAKVPEEAMEDGEKRRKLASVEVEVQRFRATVIAGVDRERTLPMQRDQRRGGREQVDDLQRRVVG